MRLLRILAFVYVLLAIASIVLAQAPNVTRYDQQVFAVGVDTQTGTPIWTNTYQASAAVCGQVAPTVPATVTNPTKLFFDDVAQPGKVCIISLSSTLLPALPNGAGYTTTLTQTDTLGQTSARSAASNPFNKQSAPPVLTGVKVSP